nr:PREDICTED: gamma-glutamyl hydrolase-like [Bemisia tabaci]
MFGGFLIFCAMAQLGGTVSDRPIVGIMTMDLERSFKVAYPGHDSYIAASYVKAVEGAGARAVPIFIGQSGAYYRKMAESINGLLIPGGGARFNGTDNFFAASKMMYDLALKMNGDNVHFPVFGVCLGFELLLRFASDDENVRRSCKGGVIHHINMPLKFSSGFKKSSLFKSLPKRTSRALQTNITINNHVWCLYQDDFKRNNLENDWKILATSDDLQGNSFIAAVEHVKYPISGVQFHPEKNIYEWGRALPFVRSPKAIEASRYFYDWLVGEAKKNNHSFAEPHQEQEALIYNFAPSHSDLFHESIKLNFTQIYLFNTRYLTLKYVSD